MKQYLPSAFGMYFSIAGYWVRHAYQLFLFSACLFFFQPIHAQDIIGAEFLSSSNGNHLYTLKLLTHFDCNTNQFSSTEKVVIFDAEIPKLIKVVELKADTNYAYELTPGVCNNQIRGCVKTRVYSAVVDLSREYGRFNCTWAYKGINKHLINLQLSQVSGLSLNVEIFNGSNDPLNRSPFMDKLPLMFHCQNQQTNYRLQFNDRDSGDIILVEPIRLSSFEPTEARNFIYPEGSGADFSQLMNNPQFTGSFLPYPGPYKPLNYVKPVMKSGDEMEEIFSFQPKSEEIKINKLPAGYFLTGLRIQEVHGDRKVNSHQAFFILQIL